MRSRKLAKKIHEIVVQFPKFLDIKEIRHGEVKSEVEFYTRSSFIAVSVHAHEKWPKWFKTRPKLRLCTKPEPCEDVVHSPKIHV